ncbi:MAG: hypothetical protein KDA87_19950 [Planctomycetales bacterium]|nr:hypothetical protein [Planctomycetales bacterium]
MSKNPFQAMPASQVLDREFLQLRAKILELAASFDRLDRGAPLPEDTRLNLLHQGIQIVLSDEPDRAERLQRLFSREYDPNWKSNLGVDT